MFLSFFLSLEAFGRATLALNLVAVDCESLEANGVHDSALADLAGHLAGELVVLEPRLLEIRADDAQGPRDSSVEFVAVETELLELGKVGKSSVEGAI